MSTRRIALGLSVAAALGAAALLVWRRTRPDPAQVLFAEAIPDWQVERARAGSAAGGEAARALLRAAVPFPSIAPELARLDAAWPDERAVRTSAAALNQALRAAGLRYFLDVQPVNAKPIVLTYAVEREVPWRAGERRVTVIRIRRLDRLNIEMGLYGETDGTQPLVFLDRIESRLVTDLPAAFTPPADEGEVERAAMAQLRRLVEAAAGRSAIASAVEKLARREALFETMQGRLHGGTVRLERPDRFIYDDGWFERMAPYSRFDHPGGPLLLDTDLRALEHADEELRAAPVEAALREAVRLLAGPVEAHEARHALEERTPSPPPGLLLDEMEGSTPGFVEMADRELRAYLGELHDSPAPACLSLAEMVRGVHGRQRSHTPHYFARRVILELVGGPGDEPPARRLERLCGLPDAELRERAAAAWKKLYGSELVHALSEDAAPPAGTSSAAALR